MKSSFILSGFLMFFMPVLAQEQHEITLLPKIAFVSAHHFKQGTNLSPDGRDLSLNNYQQLNTNN